MELTCGFKAVTFELIIKMSSFRAKFNVRFWIGLLSVTAIL